MGQPPQAAEHLRGAGEGTRGEPLNLKQQGMRPSQLCRQPIITRIPYRWNKKLSHGTHLQACAGDVAVAASQLQMGQPAQQPTRSDDSAAIEMCQHFQKHTTCLPAHAPSNPPARGAQHGSQRNVCHVAAAAEAQPQQAGCQRREAEQPIVSQCWAVGNVEGSQAAQVPSKGRTGLLSQAAHAASQVQGLQTGQCGQGGQTDVADLGLPRPAADVVK